MSDEVKLTWGKTENDLLQRWPKSADGTPEEPALLTVAMDTNAETDIPCSGGLSMLAAQAAASAALFLGEAMDISKISQVEGVLRRQTENLILIGMPGSGTWLYVPSSMLEDAKNLIRPIDEIPEQEDMQ